MKSIVVTPDAPKAVGPYSQAVLVGDTLYCSGQIPLDPASGEVVVGGVREQADRVFQNLRAVLRAAAMEFSDVIKTTIFTTDLSRFAELNEVYSSYFSEPYPARSTVEVSALPRGVQVEVELVAIRSRESVA
jgi:2-iminobutanoate/2-iminopropanoate deaminase